MPAAYYLARCASPDVHVCGGTVTDKLAYPINIECV